MEISWINPVALLENELRQRREEGLNVDAVTGRWKALRDGDPSAEERDAAARELFAELAALDTPADLDRAEPSDLDAIRAALPAGEAAMTPVPPDDPGLADRIAGAWLGRAAGCLLGKPVEKISRAGIRELLSSNGTWPISDYITERGLPTEMRAKYTWNRHSGRESLRENIVCMTEDDDMNYPMINLYVLERQGLDFRTEDVGEAWLSLMPVLRSFTAERIAYLNLLKGIDPPATAWRGNPYREWIGAQIRADMWGWTAPGDPWTAAARAWRDARLSHVRNGLYGEMFVAAVIAAAFRESDPARLLRVGLTAIPAQSRLAEAVRFALDLHGDAPDYETALDRLYARYGHYHWVHTINNAALVALALLYGEGDFERSICNVVMGGWDTDSNGATVGSILGVILGARDLPGKWIDPLNDRIRSSLRDFDNSVLTELAARTVRVIAPAT